MGHSSPEGSVGVELVHEIDYYTQPKIGHVNHVLFVPIRQLYNSGLYIS